VTCSALHFSNWGRVLFRQPCRAIATLIAQCSPELNPSGGKAREQPDGKPDGQKTKKRAVRFLPPVQAVQSRPTFPSSPSAVPNNFVQMNTDRWHPAVRDAALHEAGQCGCQQQHDALFFAGDLAEATE
jgi:hypothetical protein